MSSAIGEDLEAFLRTCQAKGIFFKILEPKGSLHSGDATKFSGLFDQSAFDDATRRCELLKVNYLKADGWPAEMPISPNQIPEMLALGRSVCAGGVEKVDPRLAGFVERFSRHFVQMGRFYFNSYLSPEGKGFGLHFDDHPVWILQIEGQKQWSFSPVPGVEKLVSTVTFPPGVMSQILPWGVIKRPDESRFDGAVLRPGDILYMPKGVWHKATAVGGSMALTLAELCATPLDVIQHAIGPRFANDILFRDPLPGFWNADGPSVAEIPASLQRAFEDSLKQLQNLVGSLTPADLYKTWRESKVREV